MNPTLYDILGVPPDATRDEIKTAWREAADRFEPGSGAGTAQFRLFNEAAEVLLDPERRAAYDAELTERPARDETAETAEPASTLASSPPPTFPPTGASADEPPRKAEDRHDGDEPARTRRHVPVAVLAVLALLAAVAVGGVVVTGVRYARADAYQNALGTAPASAERAAAAVLAYDYTSLEADRDAAAKFLTSAYRDDYLDTFNTLVQPNAAKTEAKVTAKVLASAPMLQSGEDPDRVPVLLYVNQTTTSTANPDRPSVALNRVRFDMVNVDGSWLVDGSTSY